MPLHSRTMRTPLALAFLFSVAACSTQRSTSAPAHDEPSSVAPTETRELFDGRTLAGWDGDPRFWSVVDGAIVGRSTPENPCRESTYLVWRGGTPADFELAVDYRIR